MKESVLNVMLNVGVKTVKPWFTYFQIAGKY